MRLPYFLVLAIITIIFYSIVWSSAPYSSPDTQDYQNATNDLRDGQLDELSLRPVGYSIFLLVTGSGRLLFYTQLVLYLGSVFLLLGHLRAKSRIYFFSLALLPPMVEPSAHILTETLTQFLLVAGLVCLYQWNQHRRLPLLVVGSIALTCSGLVRPTYQLLLPTLAVAIWIMNHRWRPFLLTLAISTGLMGSYSLYNFVQFHYFGTSPLLGMSLSTKTARVIDRLPDDYATERELFIRYRDKELLTDENPNMPGTVHTGKWYIWDALPEYQQITGQSTAEASARLLRLNLYLIVLEPLEYLVEVGDAATLFWLPASNYANFHSRMFYLLWTAVHFAIIGTFFASIYRRMPSDFLSCFMLVIIGYTFLISTTTAIGEPRFRQPVDLFILFIIFNQFSRKNEP